MKSKLESTGFLVNMTNLLLAIVASFGVAVSIDGNQTITAIMTKNYDVLVTMVIPTLVAFGFKLTAFLKTKQSLWNKIKASPNFMTQLITTILSGVAIFVPIVFPADTGSSLAEAFKSMQLVSIITVIALNIITPVLYYFRDRKKVSA